ncbi:TetR/AcrR family transcriptional regulator [Alkalicoccobacillus gibsonii]|uniref:TetR/AcrR family transcriptional regulator n=1 Tax=Alkalicoccobacillus gibsonii TaxID=79881 RepID=UPI001932A19A|nr:TetR family transcriptional regulator [Alkalicoccobacillus gibsonii]MBM0066791.1 TetR family transcriptional regulator [Alkalicoccobacillus gibsonii]
MEIRKQQILKATYEVVSEKGFHSVTLQDIADKAGFSKGVISYYFDNKEMILSELLTWLTDKIYLNEMNAIKDKSKAEDMLKSYVEAVFVSPNKNRTFYKVYLDFLAEASHHPVYKQINQSFYLNCWELAEKIIMKGQKENVFCQTINPSETAKGIRAMIDGCLIQWLMSNEDDHAFYKHMCLTHIRRMLLNASVD